MADTQFQVDPNDLIQVLEGNLTSATNRNLMLSAALLKSQRVNNEQALEIARLKKELESRPVTSSVPHQTAAEYVAQAEPLTLPVELPVHEPLN
jgi:hypothetical protein